MTSEHSSIEEPSIILDSSFIIAFKEPPEKRYAAVFSYLIMYFLPTPGTAFPLSMNLSRAGLKFSIMLTMYGEFVVISSFPNVPNPNDEELKRPRTNAFSSHADTVVASSFRIYILILPENSKYSTADYSSSHLSMSVKKSVFWRLICFFLISLERTSLST